MSGLLDQIVRRRRATASRRLGPQSNGGHASDAAPAPLAPSWEAEAPAAANGDEAAAWPDAPLGEEKPWAWQTAEPTTVEPETPEPEAVEPETPEPETPE